MYYVDVNKLNGKIAERRTTKEQIADKIGVDRSTFYRRLNSSTLRLSDVHKMCEYLGLTDQEAISIFLAR